MTSCLNVLTNCSDLSAAAEKSCDSCFSSRIVSIFSANLCANQTTLCEVRGDIVDIVEGKIWVQKYLYHTLAVE